uniref:Uncharacterized protein n=1 Tax=Glycine max TaxID=3847 RepID=K7KXE4_SOYBN
MKHISIFLKRKSSPSLSSSATTSSSLLSPSTTPACSMSPPVSIHGGPSLRHHHGLLLPQSRVPDLRCLISTHAFPCQDNHRRRHNLNTMLADRHLCHCSGTISH